MGCIPLSALNAHVAIGRSFLVGQDAAYTLPSL